ncbi:MAG: mechanosensitive ion channel domain-containing protein [Thermoplasmata archaeon]
MTAWTTYLPEIEPIVAATGLVVASYLLSGRAAAWLRDRGAPPAAVRWARLAISLTGVLLAAAVLFVAFGPLTTGSGVTLSAVVGLAATLALQTTIGNVIAGFILLRNRVLRLDDRIQISGVNGTVVRLGLVTTWLRMDDGSLASVSNSTLLSGPLVNRSTSERLKGEY